MVIRHLLIFCFGKNHAKGLSEAAIEQLGLQIILRDRDINNIRYWSDYFFNYVQLLIGGADYKIDVSTMEEGWHSVIAKILTIILCFFGCSIYYIRHAKTIPGVFLPVLCR